MAAALLSIAMAITLTTFYSITRAWQRGTAMAEALDHGEFLMVQLAAGLRSAYFPPPDTAASAPQPAPAETNATGTNAAPVTPTDTNAAPAAPARAWYGFALEDNGDGAGARDVISWVKTGPALLRVNDPLARGLHRVRLSLEKDEDDHLAVAVRAWRPYGNPLTFDPLEQPPHFISGPVVGLNCRVAREVKDDAWDWLDEWEDDATNRLPLAVELTIYTEAPDPGEPAVELQRTIEIPLAPLSWEGAPPQP